MAIVYENNRSLAEQKYKENDKEKNALEKDIKIQKDLLFKHTQELFKLRE